MMSPPQLQELHSLVALRRRTGKFQDVLRVSKIKRGVETVENTQSVEPAWYEVPPVEISISIHSWAAKLGSLRTLTLPRAWSTIGRFIPLLTASPHVCPCMSAIRCSVRRRPDPPTRRTRCRCRRCQADKLNPVARSVRKTCATSAKLRTQRGGHMNSVGQITRLDVWSRKSVAVVHVQHSFRFVTRTCTAPLLPPRFQTRHHQRHRPFQVQL